jgi:oxalate---CoA ligase
MLDRLPQFNNFYELIRDRGKRYPDCAAILEIGGRAFTYGDMYRRAKETARFFTELGVDRRERIAVVLPRGADYVAALCGLSSRAILVPLGPSLHENDYAQIFGDLDVSGVIVERGVDSIARNVAQRQQRCVVEVEASNTPSTGWLHLSCDIWVSRTPDERIPDDTTVLMRSSGTTGRPKYVPLNFSP